MKTIFVTTFQGVEARNFLRSSICQNLLEDPGIRLVLFTKSESHAKYYQKEFNDPRVTFEVVAYTKPHGWDKLFSHFKFLTLRTGSTNLQRRMLLERRKNYLIHYLMNTVNFVIARSGFRKIMRVLDWLLVRNRPYASYFDKYRPDFVLLMHLFNDSEVHFLRETRKRKIKSVALIYSWDKITTRCTLRLLPEKAIVYNDLVKEELIRYNEMPKHSIFVSGVPLYDLYFNTQPVGREEFFRRINSDPSRRIIVLGTMGKAFSDSDWDIIDLLYKFRDEGRIPKDVEILVRFLPYDVLEEEELKKRPELLYDYPGTRFSTRRTLGSSVDWDMSFADMAHLRDTLAHMDMLICYASSLIIEAAIFNKPVINLDFEIKKSLYLSKSPTQYFGSEHYKKALASGGVRLMNGPEALAEWINKYLGNPALDREGRRRLVEEQCKYTDGKAGERIASFVLDYLNG